MTSLLYDELDKLEKLLKQEKSLSLTPSRKRRKKNGLFQIQAKTRAIKRMVYDSKIIFNPPSSRKFDNSSPLYKLQKELSATSVTKNKLADNSRQKIKKNSTNYDLHSINENELEDSKLGLKGSIHSMDQFIANKTIMGNSITKEEPKGIDLIQIGNRRPSKVIVSDLNKLARYTQKEAIRKESLKALKIIESRRALKRDSSKKTQQKLQTIKTGTLNARDSDKNMISEQNSKRQVDLHRRSKKTINFENAKLTMDKRLIESDHNKDGEDDLFNEGDFEESGSEILNNDLGHFKDVNGYSINIEDNNINKKIENNIQEEDKNNTDDVFDYNPKKSSNRLGSNFLSDIDIEPETPSNNLIKKTVSIGEASDNNNLLLSNDDKESERIENDFTLQQEDIVTEGINPLLLSNEHSNGNNILLSDSVKPKTLEKGSNNDNHLLSNIEDESFNHLISKVNLQSQENDLTSPVSEKKETNLTDIPSIKIHKDVKSTMVGHQRKVSVNMPMGNTTLQKNSETDQEAVNLPDTEMFFTLSKNTGTVQPNIKSEEAVSRRSPYRGKKVFKKNPVFSGYAFKEKNEKKEEEGDGYEISRQERLTAYKGYFSGEEESYNDDSLENTESDQPEEKKRFTGKVEQIPLMSKPKKFSEGNKKKQKYLATLELTPLVGNKMKKKNSQFIDIIEENKQILKRSMLNETKNKNKKYFKMRKKVFPKGLDLETALNIKKDDKPKRSHDTLLNHRIDRFKKYLKN